MRTDLVERAVSPSAAKLIVVQPGAFHRAWRSKAWRARRAKLLRRECAVCGGTEPPLVLQHLWHPDSFALILRRHLPKPQTYSEWKEGYRRLHGRYTTQIEIRREQDVCPRCDSPTIRYRKRDGTWICGRKVRGRACGHAFDKPTRSVVLDRKATAAAKKQVYDEFLRIQEEYQNLFRNPPDESMRPALIEYIDESIRYLDCVDTCTMCQSCAFKWDRKGLRVCFECRVQLAPPGALCATCDPELVLCAQCGESRHHQRYATCLRCHADG